MIAPTASARAGSPTDGKNLRELGIYRQTGCYIERIRRNGILANPDGDAVLQMGDEIALVGYPDAHARLDPSFRNGKEVFDRDLLDMRIVTEEVVVKNHNAVGKRRTTEVDRSRLLP